MWLRSILEERSVKYLLLPNHTIRPVANQSITCIHIFGSIFQLKEWILNPPQKVLILSVYEDLIDLSNIMYSDLWMSNKTKLN
jgi:hypothetical protein